MILCKWEELVCPCYVNVIISAMGVVLLSTVRGQYVLANSRPIQGKVNVRCSE